MNRIRTSDLSIINSIIFKQERPSSCNFLRAKFSALFPLLFLFMLILGGPLKAESNFTKGFSIYVGGAHSVDEYSARPDVGDALARIGFGRLFLNIGGTGYSTLENAVLLESSNTSRRKIIDNQFRAGIHKDIQAIPFLRINAGITYGSGVEKCLLNCFELTRLAYLQFLANSPQQAISALAYSYAFPLPIPAPESYSRGNEAYSFDYFMLEGGISLHPYRDQKWDPYLGLDVGLGTCNIDIKVNGSCRTYKLAPKVGIQMNFSERFFVYTQLEYEHQKFQIVQSVENSEGGTDTYVLESPTFSKRTWSFGIGYNL